MLPLLHASSAPAANSTPGAQALDMIVSDYSSPSLPFSPHPPPTLLSQRFIHESDSENDNSDNDQEDSDRTEGEMNPSVVKTMKRAKTANKRPPTIGE